MVQSILRAFSEIQRSGQLLRNPDHGPCAAHLSMAALGYRSCRKPQVQPFIHVDAFFLTFDIDAPSDPIPLSCDDHGAVLTATTSHGLASLPSSLRLRLVQDARLSVWLQRDRRLQDSYQGWCTPVDQLGLCRPIKKHSFHSWRKLSEGRRCQSSERSGAAGRGSEHGAGLVFAPRRAAQAGLTGGATGAPNFALKRVLRGKTSRRLNL